MISMGDKQITRIFGENGLGKLQGQPQVLWVRFRDVARVSRGIDVACYTFLGIFVKTTIIQYT